MLVSIKDLLDDYHLHLISSASTRLFKILDEPDNLIKPCSLDEKALLEEDLSSLVVKLCDFSSRVHTLVLLTINSSPDDYYANLFNQCLSNIIQLYQKAIHITEPNVASLMKLISRWEFVLYEAYYIVCNYLPVQPFPISSVLSFTILNKIQDPQINLLSMHCNFISKTIQDFSQPSKYMESFPDVSLHHYTSGTMRAYAVRKIKDLYPVYLLNDTFIEFVESYLIRVLLYKETGKRFALDSRKYLEMVPEQGNDFESIYSTFLDVILVMSADSNRLILDSVGQLKDFICESLPRLIGLSQDYQDEKGREPSFDFPLSLLVSCQTRDILINSFNLTASLDRATMHLLGLDLGNMYDMCVFRFKLITFLNRLKAYFTTKISMIYKKYLEDNERFSFLPEMSCWLDLLVEGVSSILLLGNRAVKEGLLMIFNIACEMGRLSKTELGQLAQSFKSQFIFNLCSVANAIKESDVERNLVHTFEFFRIINLPLASNIKSEL